MAQAYDTESLDDGADTPPEPTPPVDSPDGRESYFDSGRRSDVLEVRDDSRLDRSAGDRQASPLEPKATDPTANWGVFPESARNPFRPASTDLKSGSGFSLGIGSFEGEPLIEITLSGEWGFGLPSLKGVSVRGGVGTGGLSVRGQYAFDAPVGAFKVGAYADYGDRSVSLGVRASLLGVVSASASTQVIGSEHVMNAKGTIQLGDPTHLPGSVRLSAGVNEGRGAYRAAGAIERAFTDWYLRGTGF